MGIGASLNLGLAMASANPISALFIFDSAGTLNHLQYVNTQNPVGFDSVANSMAFGHLSAIIPQPKQWDDRKPTYNDD